ncbi:hypothetical protein [Bacillus sp. SA1-12]|uniref:hypothetical protein n=1 Tax=Bacillus sp. SA1-12 TaxID=1455638 RepID=UPI0012E02919|nr:hypothetical protein [Bacillus sp. SA1-12]
MVKAAHLQSENKQYRAIRKMNKELMDKLMYEDGIIVFSTYDERPIDKKYFKKFLGCQSKELRMDEI